MNRIFKILIVAFSTLSFSWSALCMEPLLLKTIREQKPGYILLIKKLLKKDINLDFCEPEINITPLRSAICGRQFEVAQLLLEAGANANANKNQLSPLGAVAAYGYSEFIPLLLEHGAKVNEPDASGCSPFAIAAEQGRAKCTELLAKAGGNSAILLPDGHSILSKAATLGHTKIVKILLQHGVDPNIIDGENLTPLKRAAASGLIAISKLLLDSGANIHEKNERGSTPAHMAAFHGRVKMLAFLLECKPELINAHDYIGRTPLFWALQQKQFDAARYLIQKGASPNSTLLTGQTLHAWAKQDKVAPPEQLQKLLYPIKKKKSNKKGKHKKKKNKSTKALTYNQRQENNTEKKEERKKLAKSAPGKLNKASQKKQLTITERTAKLNDLLTGTTDKSYVIKDDGRTISFGYHYLDKDQPTDIIHHLFSNVAPVGHKFTYHPRVTEKRTRLKNGDRKSDTVLHTFPEALDRMTGHCIAGKFTDKKGREITNRMFIGKKLINGQWIEGLYILGLANTNGTYSCYHSFFKNMPFKDIMQQISIDMNDEDKEVLENVLDKIAE